MQQANNKQSGPDRVPNEVYKFLADSDIFFKIYIKIFNSILIYKEILQDWRNSNIFLIYKSRDASDPLNYHSIALLNTSYKTFTYFISQRLGKYLEKNKSTLKHAGWFQAWKNYFHQNMDHN